MPRRARRPKSPLALIRWSAAHPDRPGERCSAPLGIWMPEIDCRRCEAKSDCTNVCPNDVFEVRAIEEEDRAEFGGLDRLRIRVHGSRSAYAVWADHRRACELCVVACPEGAITLRQRFQH